MQLNVTSVDYAPEELHGQVPLILDLIREIPGPDRPDYWLGKCLTPIRWIDNNIEKCVDHVVVAARWEGTKIEPNARDLPIGISYVLDSSVLSDETLDFGKVNYVAIGISHETGGGPTPTPDKQVFGGRIGRFFGVGNQ